MKRFVLMTLMLSAGFLLAQDSAPANGTQSGADNSKGQMTVKGCVSRSNGDYVLMKTDPGITYELQGSGKIRLKHYLGQRVEVTGNTSPTLSSSSDATAKEGSAAPVTLNITSIKTLDKDCSESTVPR
jgi:hypothetical protein